MLQPDRNSQAGYRFGFNGREMDNEISGVGNQYDYGFRIYNPRISRFLSVDPLTGTYPWYTPYQFAGNEPILYVDLDGLEEDLTKCFKWGNDKPLIRVPIGIKRFFRKLTRHHPSHHKTRTSSKPDDSGDPIKRETIDRIEPKQIQLEVEEPEMKLIEPPPMPAPEPKPEPKPKKQEDKPKPSTIKEKPAPEEKKEEPHKDPVITQLTLDIPFVDNRAEFDGDPSSVLNDVLKKLRDNPANSVTLQPNTLYKQGEDILDLWGLTGDADTSDELVKMRGDLIKKWFKDRGIDKQVNIQVGDSNFNNAVNVTGTLTTIENK